MTQGQRPILGSSCARATTAAEMRFRIDRPIPGRRGARVIGLDPGADAIIERVAQHPWGHARFFRLISPVDEIGVEGAPSMQLNRIDGQVCALTDELTDSDVVILVATRHSDTAAAAVIGAACTVRAITAAGIIVGEHQLVGDTVTALRPHARVLMVTNDDQDVVEILAALRA